MKTFVKVVGEMIQWLSSSVVGKKPWV